MSYEFERYYTTKSIQTPEITANNSAYVVIPEQAEIVRMDVLITNASAGSASVTLQNAYSGGNNIMSVSIATTDAAGTVKSNTSPASAYKNVNAGQVLKIVTSDGSSPSLKCIVVVTYKGRLM